MKNFIPTNRRNITSQKAVKLLYKYGTDVSAESAYFILDFLYKFAKLSAEQVINRHFDKKVSEKKTPRDLFR